MKYHILYNPISGGGHGGEEIEHIKSLVDGEFTVTSVIDIEDYQSYLAAIPSTDALILSGGDGTLNKFINQADGISLNCKTYYYASGSGNDFLNDVEGAERGELIELDKYIEYLPTVEINGKTYRFINGIGYGIDGYCCEEGDRIRERSDKPVNYTAVAIKGLLYDYKPADATVIVDGEEYRYKKVWVAPTMNGRFYGGGMMPTPDQDRLSPDHKLSVMIFHDSGKIKTLRLFPSIFKGGHVKHTEAVTIHRGKEITVRYDSPRPLQIDGETIKNVSEYTARSAELSTVKR